MSTAKDQQSQETWRQGDNVRPYVLSCSWTRRPKVLGRRWWTYRGSMGKFIEISARTVVKKDGQVEGLGGLLQVEEKRRRLTLVWNWWKRNLLKQQQANKRHSKRNDGWGKWHRAVGALESVVSTEQHQMRSEWRVCFVLSSPRFPCGRRAKSSFQESGWSIRRKWWMSSVIERERTRYWMGPEKGILGDYGFQD